MGGTPEQLTNRLLLEQTPGTLVLFLDAPFPVLYDRCMLEAIAQPENSVRPVLANPVEAEARFKARQPLYRRLANLTIQTGSLNTGEVAAAVASALENLNATN